MRKIILFSWLILLSIDARAETEIKHKFIKTPTGFLMVLQKDDQLFEALEQLMLQQKIPSATFFGMGFVNARFGFFNNETKKFDPREFKSMELASLQGSLAWEEEKPSIHAHGIVTGKDFQSFGGHLLAAQVDTGSMEITIFTNKQRLERKIDPKIDAPVLQIK
ncbi:PPC domain-containing DNA-binding protein [Bdellovibrio sp. HCB209]|uniref:PPC domain-containing DNA-binding protein n=1 Tax=Bdellovibrio sp. HCB209 TaxID=3394354 RepID=UPI0039B46570